MLNKFEPYTYSISKFFTKNLQLRNINARSMTNIFIYLTFTFSTLQNRSVVLEMGGGSLGEGVAILSCITFFHETYV